MRGPLFDRLLSAAKIRLLPGETLEDFETCYSIIVEERRKRGHGGELDEKIALFSLCQWWFPGKPPAYRKSVRSLRRKMSGIAFDANLRNTFREMLSPRLLSAKSLKELDVRSLSGTFKVLLSERQE